MSSDAKIDYQRQAIAAMHMALDASGFERVKWVRVAQAWQDMGRWTERRDVAAPSPSTASPSTASPSTASPAIVRAEHD